MSYTLTGGATVVTLDNPVSMTPFIGKRVVKHTFQTGTYKVLDWGKSQHRVTITGLEFDDKNPSNQFPLSFPIKFSVQGLMYDVENLAGDEITVGGLPDPNWDGVYFIGGFSWELVEGRPDRYRYELELVKKT